MPLIKAAPRVAKKLDRPEAAPERYDLRSALQSDKVEDRRAAARAAVRSGDMALLLAHLSLEPDQSIREVILNGVVRRHDHENIQPLLDLLRSEDVALRSVVIETLQIMGGDVLLEIERLLSDPDADVRIFCMNILQCIRAPRVADIALDVAMRDENVNVCAAAVDILGDVGRPDMAEALLGVAARFPHQPFLSFAIRAALKRIV